MAIPVYLWLKDDGGADIKGSVDVQDREAVSKWWPKSTTCTSRPITTPAN